MKKLLLVLALYCLAGCEVYLPYADPPPAYFSGTVEFCDSFGCRYVTGPYYYDHGDLIYWDAHFNCWIGPRGYLLGTVWHPGYHPGYRDWYHDGRYHTHIEHRRQEWHEDHSWRERHR